MRNFKKTLAFMLALIMTVSVIVTVSATPSKSWTSEAVEYLDGIGVSEIGNDTDKKLTRDEFVLWVAKIESHQLSNNAWKDTIASVHFTDVTDAHNKAAIAYSYKAGYIIGNGDGTFSPDKTVTLAEASAVIVRLMGYESKVTGLADEWDMNYMRVANTYCKAFDDRFYQGTDTFNPDYELTKGEGAYLLATVMNGVNYHPEIHQVTADGVNLGEYFNANVKPTVKADAYYIVSLPRISEGLSTLRPHVNGKPVERYTNVLDVTGNVILQSTKDGRKVQMRGSEFLKLVRIGKGLSPMPDIMNEEPEINIFETVRVGTMVNMVLPDEILQSGRIDDYKQVGNFKVHSGSTVVDTVLQMTSGDKKHLGYGVHSVGDADYRPTLPASYRNDMAVSWSHLVKAEDGKVLSAVLSVGGNAYQYGAELQGFDKDWNPLSVDDAVKQILNIAQGEAFLVFNDINGDGRYDTVYVKESYPFAFTAAPNQESKNTDVQDYLTSISGGKVVGTATPKGNAMGTVIWNRKVGYSNNSYTMASTDPYTLTPAPTGKLQLVLAASNAHPAYDAPDYAGYSSQLPYYTVVDLASFYTGIIEEVDAWAVENHYTAKVKLGDGSYMTVYIPMNSEKTVTLPVTVNGVTAEYTFDSSKWGTFMTDTKNAAMENGIARPDNVQNGVGGDGQPSTQYLNFAAAWMAGKYVEFATDKNGKVICINGTEREAGYSGFVTFVEKTETGDNTYFVTIATEGNRLNEIQPELLYANTLNAANFIDGWHGPTSWRVQQGSHAPITGGREYFTEIDGIYGVDRDGDGKLDRKDGALVDDNGNKFIEKAIAFRKNHGVVGFDTFEVRASASGMFDFDNYAVYNQLFAGSIIDPNHSADGKVNPEKDLIYVKIMQDAGKLSYVLYNDAREIPAEKTENYNGSEKDKWASSVNVKVNGHDIRWWYPNAVKTDSGFWHKTVGEKVISITEVEGTREQGNRANGVAYYKARYNATVGFHPYYVRTWDSAAKQYTYALHFETVKIMENVLGEADAMVDTAKTLMIPVFRGESGSVSVHVQVKNPEERASYESRGYFVDEEGYVFSLIAGTTDIVYKKDASGNILYHAVKYNWDDGSVKEEKQHIAFSDHKNLGLAEGEKLLPYATVTVSEKPRTDKGWYPGATYITVDGVRYDGNRGTEIAIVMPSSKGFAVEKVTVGMLLDSGNTKIFATDWTGAISNNVPEALVLMGTRQFMDSKPDIPVKPVDKNRVVYLDATANAVVRQNELSKEWMVISNKSAYMLPTGEDVGAIYRSYPTYEQALHASIKIDLEIKGGSWYIIDEKNRIVSDSGDYIEKGKLKTMKGTITYVNAEGVTIATMNGNKNVNITDMPTSFFYFDSRSSVLHKAGENGNVKMIGRDAYESLFTEQKKAIEAAQKAYDAAKIKYENGMLSKERLAYYEDALTLAKAALQKERQRTMDLYFNGRFWGIHNSPAYREYLISMGSFQKPAEITFDYIMMGDTLCVFSDSFVIS